MNSSLSVGALPMVPYQLQSISPVAAPSDSEGSWFRYVIAQGVNEITGLRLGSASEVEYAVREMVDRLNERSAGKSVKKLKPVPVRAVAKPAAPAAVQDQT